MISAMYVANQVGSFLIVMSAWSLAHKTMDRGGPLDRTLAVLFGLAGVISATFLLFRFTGADLALLTAFSKYVYVAIFLTLGIQASGRPLA